MSIGKSSDWRTKPRNRTCRICGAIFLGAHNSLNCQPCKAAAKAIRDARFFIKNPHYRHAKMLSKYGITKVEYEKMRRRQRYRCALCHRREKTWNGNGGRLSVDHCHTTGVVRGLLCPMCNRGLGLFYDRIDVLERAIEYLGKHAQESGS